MHTLKPNFDPAALAMMGQVCDDAFNTLRASTFYPHPADEQEARSQTATRVLAAVAEGECDPERLKELALRGLK
jgi:hypothetical protein